MIKINASNSIKYAAQYISYIAYVTNQYGSNSGRGRFKRNEVCTYSPIFWNEMVRLNRLDTALTILVSVCRPTHALPPERTCTVYSTAARLDHQSEDCGAECKHRLLGTRRLQDYRENKLLICTNSMP